MLCLARFKRTGLMQNVLAWLDKPALLDMGLLCKRVYMHDIGQILKKVRWVDWDIKDLENCAKDITDWTPKQVEAFKKHGGPMDAWFMERLGIPFC